MREEAGYASIVLKCYFDESGSKNDPNTPFMVVSGLLAPVASWLDFDVRWQVVLERFGVAVHHMKDFSASRGEFEGWKGDEEKRRCYLSDLIGCIEGTVIYAASGFIHRDSEPLDAPKSGLAPDGRRYQQCLMYAFHCCSAIRTVLGTDELIEMVVAENSYDWRSRGSYKRLEAWPQPFAAFTLGSPRKLLPLQAADLFVWEYAKSRNAPGRRRDSWERLSKIPHMAAGLGSREDAVGMLENVP